MVLTAGSRDMSESCQVHKLHLAVGRDRSPQATRFATSGRHEAVPAVAAVEAFRVFAAC